MVSRVRWALLRTFWGHLKTFWGISEDILETFKGLSMDFPWTSWWLSEVWGLRFSEDFLMTFWELSADFLWKLWRLSVKFLKIFRQLSEDLLKAFSGLFLDFSNFFGLFQVFWGLFLDFLRTFSRMTDWLTEWLTRPSKFPKCYTTMISGEKEIMQKERKFHQNFYCDK